jgi:hypothetical protein
VVFSARVGVFRSDVGVRPPGWRENANDNLFVKVGQWPPLLIDPPPELAKALGTEDTELYKKALTNGNSAFGIGALAYFRRVIENKVNMILDLIGNAAQLANFESEELKRLEEIKVSHHVDAKIEYASKILPPHLRAGGHNPLNKLYAVASSGLHGKTDEQCLDDFQNARFEFEYLFKNLVVRNEEDGGSVWGKCERGGSGIVEPIRLAKNI